MGLRHEMFTDALKMTAKKRVVKFASTDGLPGF